MLDKKDLKQIKDIVQDVVSTEIEKLAQITAKGFESVDKRFESVDKRFESVDKRFDGIQEQINEISKRLDKIEYEIVQVRSDLNYLESIVREIRRDVDLIKTNSLNQHEAIKDLELQVLVIEKKVGIKTAR